MSIVFAKLGISIACILILVVVLWKRKSLTSWLEGKSVRSVLAVSWILFRLLPFIGVYILAGFEPTSDVNGFWDEASKASQGMVVYRDFWSPYSPLYPYFLAIWLKIWYDPKMIVLTMAAMDGVAIWISWHFYRPFQSKGTFLFRALVYLILPGSLILCIVGGQEDVWMWLFVAAAYLVRERKVSVTWYAVILAIGLLITKAIFVLILVPLFFLEKDKLRFLIPMALIGVASLGILYPLVGLEFLQPLDEAKTLRAPNILSVLNPWFYNQIGVGEKFWNWIGLAISVGLACLSAWRLRNADFRIMLSRVWVVLYGTMMVVQQSAYSNYIFLFLIPLVFYIINWNSRKQVILLLIYNALCAIHSSVWWRLDMPCYMNPRDMISSKEFFWDYSMQTAIVLLTLYFVYLAFPKSNNPELKTV